MLENVQASTTDGQHSAADKKDKNPAKVRHKKSKSEGRRRSSKKDPDFDRNDMEWNANADKLGSNSEWEVQDSSKERPSAWDPQEFHQQTDNVDAWNEKDGPNRAQDLPSPNLAEASHRQRSSKKGKKGWRKQAEKVHSAVKFSAGNGDRSKPPVGPSRTASDNDFGSSSDEVEYKEKEKNRSNNHSLKSSAYSQDSRGRKEDTLPSVPRRAIDRHEVDDNGVDKAPSKPKPRTDSTEQKEKSDEAFVEDADDKRPTKPKRRTTRRGSPENKAVNDNDDELGVSSFHSLRIDSDKPTSRSNNSSRRTPNSARRNKSSSGGRPSRRRLKDKTPGDSDDLPADKNIETSDDVDDRGTQEINLKDEDQVACGNVRLKRERRRDRERPVSNNDVMRDSRKTESNTSTSTIRSSRSSLSSRRTGICRSHSERWNRAVEGVEDEGAEDPQAIRRRAHESLNRASDGLSRSAHSKVRRHHSTGLTKVNASLNSRSHHSVESDRHTPSDGRRTPRRVSRRHQTVDSAGSFGDDSTDSFGECGRSQGTLDSIDDFEDFGEDFYGMALQTPGMVDFEEEMLDLMRRANPEVTDHLDRRVHRKREMVVYDQNMPMMTRQALLTRQASALVQRQFFDGRNIDRKRLLLRNDSMSSNNSHDELTLSSHRSMRSAHGRRAPPRAKSSGLGAMGGNGYMQSMGGPTRPSDSDKPRRVYRSRSTHGGTQTDSFNQFYQNKPNKVRSLSRRTSGDLIQPHTMREQHGLPRSSDHTARRRSLQRANSTTALRKSTSSDHFAPRLPERRNSKDKNRRKKETYDGRYSSDEDSGSDTELASDYGSPSSFLRKPTKLSSLHGKKKDVKSVDKNDMSNKRNRSKLHLLMYKTKMCVEMEGLFKNVRDGETPRSPIKTLRMPSP